eukprot:gene13856-13978_t
MGQKWFGRRRQLMQMVVTVSPEACFLHFMAATIQPQIGSPGAMPVTPALVVIVVQQLLPRLGLVGLPLFALGASSGGAFALLLPSFVPVAGVCSQVMALPPALYSPFLAAPPAKPPDNQQRTAARGRSNGSNTSAAIARHPPVLFVPMARDRRTARGVQLDVDLRSQLPVTTEFLSQRIPELAQGGTADKVVQLLVDEQILDRSSHLLLSDPRLVDWRRAISHSSIAGAEHWQLTADASPLSEVLNVAWAAHEIVSDVTAEVLDWLEQQLERL